jgi:hypothetical protein
MDLTMEDFRPTGLRLNSGNKHGQRERDHGRERSHDDQGYTDYAQAFHRDVSPCARDDRHWHPIRFSVSHLESNVAPTWRPQEQREWRSGCSLAEERWQANAQTAHIRGEA